MPLTVFGTFEVRASRDLGDLGPEEGAPLTLKFPIYRHLTRVIPWLILLPLLLLKGNRTPRALLVLIPLLVVQGLLAGMIAMLPEYMRSEAGFMVTALTSINLGLAACWLLLHRIGGRNRVITCLLALLILTVFGVAALFAHGSFDYMLGPLAILYGYLMSAVLLSMVFAAVFCRKRYRAGRFTAFLVLFSLLVSLVQTLPFLVFGIIASGVIQGGLDQLAEMLVAFVVFILVSAAVLFGLHLPYLILGFRSGFFRERFFAALRLPAMVPAPPVPAQAEAETPG